MVRNLLSRIARGETGAVRECMNTYSGLVWSLARRFSRTSAEAEDAVQEIFLDLWKSAGRYDPGRSAESSFVTMVARRRLIDRMRRADRRPRLVALAPEHGDSTPNLEHRRMEKGAEVAEAENAFLELPPERQKVVRLSVVLGMSHRQIAERTGLPLGTVKSHARRGLAQVRERLGAAVRGARGGPMGLLAQSA